MKRQGSLLDSESLWLYQGLRADSLEDKLQHHIIVTSDRTSAINERLVISVLVTLSNVYLILSLLGGLCFGALSFVVQNQGQSLLLILLAVIAVIQGVGVWALLQAVGSIVHNLNSLRRLTAKLVLSEHSVSRT